MVAPVTSDEMLSAIRGMTDGAPGTDGRRLRDLREIPVIKLQHRVNLRLLAGLQLAILTEGVTVLLPKVQGTRDPAQHRPITMSDMVARCFHRILAKRLDIFMPFNIRQKAFRSGDGTAESVWFLQQRIRKHT